MTAPAHNLLFNQVKAGLSSVNPDDVSHKIIEVSKDTKFFAHQKERSKSIDHQIDELKYKLRTATESQLNLALIQVDSFIKSLEKKRDIESVYFHADLDAFFASVEEIDDPTLVGTPFVVGGSIKHGVVSTSSYEARKFGVRSGMAIFIALSLCPHLRIVDHHGNRYFEMSQKVKDVFAIYDPNFTSFGLDEATLNVTDYLKKTGRTPLDIAKEIQAEVTRRTGLTISIGIAPTHQLSKISSDINKPNGVFIVPNSKDEMINFIRSLPVRKIPGIGGVTERKLQELHFEKMSDIMDRRDEVWFLFSKTFCSFIFSSAVGIPYSPKTADDRKSISKERTFDATNDIVNLMEMVEYLAEKLAINLQRGGIGCRTVTLKFKSVDFQVYSHCITFDRDTSKISDITGAAIKLLMEEHRTLHLTLRLIGVRVSNLVYPGQARQKTIKDWVVKGFIEPQTKLISEPNVNKNQNEEENEKNKDKMEINIKNQQKKKKGVIEKYFTEKEFQKRSRITPLKIIPNGILSSDDDESNNENANMEDMNNENLNFANEIEMGICEQPNIDPFEQFELFAQSDCFVHSSSPKRPEKTSHGTFSIGSFFGCELPLPKSPKKDKQKSKNKVKNKNKINKPKKEVVEKGLKELNMFY
ncbi:DNA polymerase kappa [Tritrichomonas foetus]|uniref:DNA polymerase kappa n=1 Tax=Tritrichomonas foetus TaxID=1144522 RepID=A0A1J4J804_9EUKA|nr:DNA polymerase kappa [Tritrichomonas foetus]|eukprot:OHS94367.1 DNA polymerase kappa [Tritrichomonas foetus]